MENDHHLDEKLVTIAEFEDDFEAEIAHTTLEEVGIDSSVLGGDLVANMPHFEPIKVQLQVFEKDVARAKQALEEQSKLADDQAEGQ